MGGGERGQEEGIACLALHSGSAIRGCVLQRCNKIESCFAVDTEDRMAEIRPPIMEQAGQKESASKIKAVLSSCLNGGVGGMILGM
jgi:hypothetical protein